MRKGGERFPVTIEASALGEDEPGYLCVVRDVSHEEGERERLHDAHAVARLISWEWDPSDDSIALSSGLIDLTGLEVPDDPKLAGLMTLVPEPYASELMDAFARVLEGRQEDVVLESPWEVPNPEIRWVETRGRPVHDADGHVVRLRGITQDITARKEAEIALQRSEDRLAQAQRVSRIGSFEIDYRDGSTQWSSELYRLYGIEGEPEITVEEARAMLPPEDRERVDRGDGRRRRGRQPSGAGAPVHARKRDAMVEHPARGAGGQDRPVRRARHPAGHHGAQARRAADPPPGAPARRGGRRGDRHRSGRPDHELERGRGADVRVDP